jgi:hypothetical protein
MLLDPPRGCKCLRSSFAKFIPAAQIIIWQTDAPAAWRLGACRIANRFGTRPVDDHGSAFGIGTSKFFSQTVVSSGRGARCRLQDVPRTDSQSTLTVIGRRRGGKRTERLTSFRSISRGQKLTANSGSRLAPLFQIEPDAYLISCRLKRVGVHD